jgi:hypothetical protein
MGRFVYSSEHISAKHEQHHGAVRSCLATHQRKTSDDARRDEQSTFIIHQSELIIGTAKVRRLMSLHHPMYEQTRKRAHKMRLCNLYQTKRDESTIPTQASSSSSSSSSCPSSSSSATSATLRFLLPLRALVVLPLLPAAAGESQQRQERASSGRREPAKLVTGTIDTHACR